MGDKISVDSSTNVDLTKLKPYNAIIQVCPICGKPDAYKGDGHSCTDYILQKINNGFNES